MRYPTTALILVAFLLGGCAADVYKRAEVQHKSDYFTFAEIERGGLALLPIAGQAAGGRQEIGNAIDSLVIAALPQGKYMSWREVSDRLNHAGLVSDFQEVMMNYQRTGIADTRGLQRIGKELQVKYLLYVTVGGLKQESDTRHSGLSGTIETYDSKETNLLGQVWDATSGEMAWEATSRANSFESELTYIAADEKDFHRGAAEALAGSLFQQAAN